MNQKKYTVYLKELIDGMPSPIFSAQTFPPHYRDEVEFKDRYQKILQVSRERYCKPRQLVEEKINESLEKIEQEEESWEKRKEELKQKKSDEKNIASSEKQLK